MARIGISYQDVATAAATVQGHNQIPTVDRIREILQTGSKSTIARHLKEWKNRNEQNAGFDGIPEELSGLVKGLWERLQQDAEDKISRFEQEANKEIEATHQSYIQEQKEHIALQKIRRELDEQVYEQTAAIEELQTSLKENTLANVQLTERNTALYQQVEDQKTETHRLHKLLNHLQTNLEHYQTSMQKLREEQALATENQRMTYEREIETAKQKFVAAENHRNELQRIHDQLATEMKFVTRQNEVLLQDKDRLQAELQEKTIQENNLQHRYTNLQTESEAHKTNNEKNLRLIRESEKKIAVFIEQIQQLSQSLNAAKDNIRLLRDEKLFLVQEKANLEGQFKQLKKASA